MPSFIHPSVSSRIIDEDIVFITSQGLSNLFQAFVSEKGEDRITKYVTSISEYLLEYGRPNFAKYGQTGFNIIQWIGTTGGVYCLRVTPADASYSNHIFGLDVSIPVAANATEFEIQPFSETLSNAIEHASISAALTATVPGAGTGVFLPYKFLGITVKGRGVGYNDYAIRFTPLETYADSYPDYMVYELEVIQKVLNSEVLMETFYVSFDPDSINATSRESMFIEDVVNVYSEYIHVIFDHTSFDMIGGDLAVNPSKINYMRPADSYLTEIDEADGVTVVDIFANGGSTVTVPVTVPLTTPFMESGLLATTYLESGSDGTGNDLLNAETLLIDAYSGATDPSMIDKKATEIDIILDANYTTPIKSAIEDMVSAVRGDCMFMADLGFRPTVASAIDRRVLLGFNTETVAVWAQDFRIYDAYEKREIRVTTPYLLASKIPTNDNAYNIGKNFVGPRRGTIGGFIADSMSWWPTEPEKSELYSAQVNYIQREPKSLYLGTQLTSKKQNTPLSNISMARASFRMLRVSERIADDYRFEYYNSATFASLTNSINNELYSWIANETCESIDVSVSASAYEKSIKLLNVRIVVKFTDIIERIAITFAVKR